MTTSALTAIDIARPVRVNGGPSIKSTREQIVAALTLIDRYAQLRLGAEYLAAFEATRVRRED